MDRDFLQYIKETGFDNLLDIDKKDIIKIKDTLHYQMWQLGKAYQEFTEAMRETKLGSMIISLIEFLNRCFNKIF